MTPCEHEGCTEEAELRCQAGTTIEAMRVAQERKFCTFHYREMIRTQPVSTSRLLTSTEGYSQLGAE